MKSISEYFDHTNLRQEANKTDIENLCKEAIKNNFTSVCTILNMLVEAGANRGTSNVLSIINE
tara:strand:- start:1451 stop:1639 length:189 start_codon:yes stop_codon:yes gene_type:complete